ncbi:hypothetical protein QM797_10115 [Rhodococcus sp. IEGM 1381]|uniref:hypothetical protein n=1 Tax=Rhodococcus sp. IEGM 1381 TaxID=3047085 RepID=UPI0024B67B3D|nr:hypothetical protein [Rhodococcus sp. IEGM 1381]MDI9895080.1 hypothetical protein [Rhodococcus sp. IEGM 1381]
MLLAQAPVQEIIVQSKTPWWTIGSAVLVALIGWFVIHRTSKTRDLENWRRTTITTAVAELIEKSDSYNLTKNNLLGPNFPRGDALMVQLEKLLVALDGMNSKMIILSICGSKVVHARAEEIYEFNKTDDGNNIIPFVNDYLNDPTKSIDSIRKAAESYTTDEAKLRLIYDQLIYEAQIATGVKKKRRIKLQLNSDTPQNRHSS